MIGLVGKKRIPNDIPATHNATPPATAGTIHFLRDFLPMMLKMIAPMTAPRTKPTRLLRFSAYISPTRFTPAAARYASRNRPAVEATYTASATPSSRYAPSSPEFPRVDALAETTASVDVDAIAAP